MRRPIAARESGWAKRFARFLARVGVAPNTVSLLSVLFALIAGVCLWATAPGAIQVVAGGTTRGASQATLITLFLVAAACIQARLLCNLFDGMLAVEWKRASKLGAIFNDFPDRPADVFVLVGCGYAAGPQWVILGYIAAILALLTAYTRVLGAAIGAGEHFTGPMAKQHRMALATLACLGAALESVFNASRGSNASGGAMWLALIVVIFGCIVTIWRRLKLIARDLEAKTPAKTPAESAP